LIYELNARIYGRRFDDITRRDLANFHRLGFSHIWLMGIWRISPGALAISKRFGADFEGSPYAVPAYEPNPALGDEASLRALRDRAHREGLRIIVDFVPNHTAFDAPLLAEHPEYYILSNPALRDERPEWFFNHPSGHRVAYGRDPHFPGWIDTAQLDYSNPALRRHMTEVLGRLSELADGVRCDMAMLLLREQVKRQWYTHAPWEWFNERMPDEFWRSAIVETRNQNPEFLFIAEAYWGKEAYLQQLGFDYTYNKSLYDKIVSRGWEGLTDYLQLTSPAYMSRSVHFIENHDEERAQHVFGPELHRQAAALVVFLPGAPLIHQGQMEGRRERLPVQLIRPRMVEEDDPTLAAFYQRLLRLAAGSVFRSGQFLPFDSGVRGLIAFVREHEGQLVLVAIDFRHGRALEAAHGEISAPAMALPGLAPGPRQLRDLWSGKARGTARLENGRLLVDLDRLRTEVPFFVLEIR
jgi:glycosidase